MAELAEQHIETADVPQDFASRAMETLTTDPDAAQPEPRKEAAKAEPVKADPAKREVPAELFGGKKSEEAAPIAPKSEFDEFAKADFKDPKRREDWEKLVNKGKTFEKQASESAAKIAEMEKRIADAETKGKETESLQAKLADLEKREAEARALVQKVNIELDPDFRRVHIEGRQRLIKNAQTIIEESGGDAKAVETALNLKGKPRVDALREIAAELDNFQSGRLGRVIDELTALDETAESKRSNPDEFFKTRQQEAEVREKQEHETLLRNANLAYDSVKTKLSGELEVLRPVEGLDWWNEQAKAIQAKARQKWETNTDPGVAAEVCLKAEAMEVYRDLFKSEREEHAKEKETLTKRLDEAETQLKKLYGTAPGLRGGGSSATANNGKHRDFADRTFDAMTGRDQ